MADAFGLELLLGELEQAPQVLAQLAALGVLILAGREEDKVEDDARQAGAQHRRQQAGQQQAHLKVSAWFLQVRPVSRYSLSLARQSSQPWAQPA